MNKQRFSQVVREYHGLSPEDRNKLHELVKTYPYSQIIHTLVAKANNDGGTDISRQTLSYAAMYATDRVVLKEIIESRPAETSTPPQTVVAQVEEQEQHPTYSHENDTYQRVTVQEDQVQGHSNPLADKVWSDLEALKKSKAAYFENNENTEADEPTVNEVTTPTVKKTSTRKKSTTETKSTPAKKSPAKTSATKKSTPKKTTTARTTSTSTKKTSSAKTGTSGTTGASKEEDEVDKKEETTSKSTASKKKADVKPKTAQIKKQKEIIEKFIDKEPRISPKTVKASNNQQKDLSENSTSFGENLISENLAQILIAQGKKEKAVDIYKKLIWKFPQKKSYFAALIEDLQN